MSRLNPPVCSFIDSITTMWYDPSSTVTPDGSGIVQARRKTGTGSATGTDTGVHITIGLN